MKTRIISSLLLICLTISGLIQTSCMGKFALLKKLYTWNEKATGNKFIDNLLFWILNILPVYGFVVFVDAVILNLIEFWTGSNPLAMNEGDRMEKRFQNGGDSFLALATRNRMEVKFDQNPDRNFAVVYVPATKSWMLETEKQTLCMAKELENNQVQLLQSNGQYLSLSKDFSARNVMGVAWQLVASK